MDENIICRCNAVSEAEIVEAIKSEKAKTLEDIQYLTGASTGCHRCARIVLYLLKKHLSQQTNY